MSFFHNIFLKLGISSVPKHDLSDERMEEYRMITGFEPIDIAKFRNFFLQQTGGNQDMEKETFLAIPCIAINPLKDRVSHIFGYDTKKSLDFLEFLTAASSFNGPGRKDVKIRTAFRIQDIDNDGVISKSDLQTYLNIVTNDALLEFEMKELVAKVMHESSSDPDENLITFHDFQRVVAKSDFEAKIHIQFYSS
jgi:serine/threonine-protein phosphatase 2B regulatory subunit